MHKLLTVASVIAMTPTASANAATITYNDAAVVPYLKQFNPMLGTLQSVTFNNRYVANFYFNYSGNPDIQTGPIVRLAGTIGNARYGTVAFDDLFQSNKQDPRTIGVNISRTVSATFSDGLSYYIGNGIMPVAAFTNFTVTPSSFANVSFPSPFSYVSVTYTYLAGVGAVPEPSTWLTMLVGFAMVAGAARYRRRSVKIVYA